MQTAQRLTSEQRNRAVERLRLLTAGATFVGVSATVGLAWLAAWSNPGTQAAAAVTTTRSTATGSSSSTSASSGSTSSRSLDSTSVGSSATTAPAHASGGGS